IRLFLVPCPIGIIDNVDPCDCTCTIDNQKRSRSSGVYKASHLVVVSAPNTVSGIVQQSCLLHTNCSKDGIKPITVFTCLENSFHIRVEINRPATLYLG